MHVGVLYRRAVRISNMCAYKSLRVISWLCSMSLQIVMQIPACGACVGCGIAAGCASLCVGTGHYHAD